MKSHWVAIIFAIMTGLIVVAPNIVFINADSYKGLPLMYSDAEYMYLSKINSVYQGCMFNCNSYIHEYGYTNPHFNSTLSEVILAAPGIILNISVVKLKIVYEFLLPAVFFLLVYSLIFRLIENKWWSIVGACFVVLGQNILNATDLLNIPYIIDAVRLKAEYTQFLSFSRPVHPQFSSTFFFIYLHILLSFLIKKSWKWCVLLALTYGFSFYVYFFTYAFLTVVQLVCTVACLLRKEWKNFQFFSLSIFVGLIIGIPQFIQISRLFSHPYYSTIPTGHLIMTHTPDISLVGVILFTLFIIISILYIKKFRILTLQAYFLSILVISCFITRNQHVISGMIMQYDHFEKYFFTPILVMVCCFCINIFFNKNNCHHILPIIFLSILPIIDSSIIQYRSYQRWLPHVTNTQRFVPVLDWLNNNVPLGSVVSASDELSSIIPLYTHNYVLWTALAGQWISTPGRAENFSLSQTSSSQRQEIGHKYGVDYYIEEKDNHYFVKNWRGDIITPINK